MQLSRLRCDFLGFYCALDYRRKFQRTGMEVPRFPPEEGAVKIQLTMLKRIVGEAYVDGRSILREEFVPRR
jgi:hypothetical protein